MLLTNAVEHLLVAAGAAGAAAKRSPGKDRYGLLKMRIAQGPAAEEEDVGGV